MSKEEDQFDPIADIKRITTRLYREGKLPVIFLVLVVIYNMIFFTFPAGYELYLLLPAVGTMFLIIYQYWDKKEDERSMIIAAVILSLSAGIDILVSFTFIFSPSGEFDYRSVPTLIIDILAIATFVGWYLEFQTEVVSESTSYNQSSL